MRYTFKSELLKHSFNNLTKIYKNMTKIDNKLIIIQ